ncbi:MAG: MBL fold metallo-hydrolase [Bacteroidales bacterium]|nr:MBL fold metallo-hydrolase [Bacteroidales bacterium]MDT8432912.1 MBL fold metallo-hydrolase [Bacteroidales bacterium]
MDIQSLHLGTLRVNALEMIMGVPEELVREQYTIDSNNQMRIGMNGLIVETGDRVILFDPGCATFLSKSLAETYDLVMEQPLTTIVAEAGYRPEEITDVVFTHLHFDHGSGAFLRIPGGIVKAFPNARYVVSSQQLGAIEKLPSDEQSSFFHKLLRFAGELSYLEEWQAEGIRFFVSHGHTDHMVVPIIDADDHDVVFATDLLPMKIFMEPGAFSYYDVAAGLLESERKQLFSMLGPDPEIIWYHE